MATLPGGSCWSFCCCSAVLGVMTLNPAATSMLSLFCVLVVVAQPTVSANRAMTLMMLNETCICFMFLGSFRFAVVLEMISSARENSQRNFRNLFSLCL